jgi:hypothetical protein
MSSKTQGNIFLKKTLVIQSFESRAIAKTGVLDASPGLSKQNIGHASKSVH